MTKAEHVKALYEAFLYVKPIEFYGQKLHVIEYCRDLAVYGVVKHTFKLERGSVIVVMDREELV